MRMEFWHLGITFGGTLFEESSNILLLVFISFVFLPQRAGIFFNITRKAGTIGHSEAFAANTRNLSYNFAAA